MMPDHEDHHDPDMTPSTERSMRKITSVLGLTVGTLFVLAFAYLRLAEGDTHLWMLGLGVFFLLAPLFANRFLH